MALGRLWRLLRSLQPNSPEELNLLRGLVRMAQSVQDWASDLGLAATVVWERCATALGTQDEFPRVFNSLPPHIKNEFYQLVEAVEVYRSIHGASLSPDQIRPEDPAILQELRRIRDWVHSAKLTRAY